MCGYATTGTTQSAENRYSSRNPLGGCTGALGHDRIDLRINPEVGELLIQRGADLSIRARVPGHYEHKGEILDVSAAEYAAVFPLR